MPVLGDLNADREATLDLVAQFHDAFNRQDVEAVMALMTDDCVFENTFPAPDGARHAGQAAVRAAFAEFFSSSPGARFETERILPAAGHAVVCWRYEWSNAGAAGHVRGVDVFTLRDGKIAEKLAYVKG